MSTGDGGVPLFLRVANGNEADQAVFAELLRDFRARLDLDALFVADSALYSAQNLATLGNLRWVCRVPRTLGEAGRVLAETRGQPLWRVTFTKATGSPRLKATTPGWCTVG
jgi:transposase